MNKKLVLVASDSKATMTKAAIVSIVVVVVVAARVSNYTQETRRNATKYNKKKNPKRNQVKNSYLT